MGRRTKYTPGHLRRQESKRDPRLALVVFCEGKNTEPKYIKAFANEHGNMLVEISRKTGVPLTLVQAAIDHRGAANQMKNSFEAKDQVWVVCDCDAHPNLNKALALARDHQINVAYSNPCFELWAYLHFAEHDAPMSRGDMQRLLKSVMKKYLPNSKVLDYTAMRVGYPTADQRAERMSRRRMEEDNPLGNPFTNVHLLMRLIRKNGKVKIPG